MAEGPDALFLCFGVRGGPTTDASRIGTDLGLYFSPHKVAGAHTQDL
jgi:hypothetical protein